MLFSAVERYIFRPWSVQVISSHVVSWTEKYSLFSSAFEITRTLSTDHDEDMKTRIVKFDGMKIRYDHAVSMSHN